MISNNAERILNRHIREATNKDFVVIHKHVFPKGMSAKNMAHYCFHKGILFYWSCENYYFSTQHCVLKAIPEEK